MSKTKRKTKEYLPVKDYAKKHNIPGSTVYNQVSTGALKSKKIGNFILVLDEPIGENRHSRSIMPKFDSPKNWIEDYKHDNGNYLNKCTECKEHFFGHKRRFICKECFQLPY